MIETITQTNTVWRPRIVAFFCNWCTYTAADLAGVSRLKYAANIRVIRLMCSGRVDPQFILDALAKGADGVLIGGCHPGDCHYVEGNFKMLRQFPMLNGCEGYGHRGRTGAVEVGPPPPKARRSRRGD